ERHWKYWDEALKSGVRELTPFPGPPASAVQDLQDFLKKHEDNMGQEFGLAEDGTMVFREALRHLEASGGRRDGPVRFLERQLTSAQDNLKEQVAIVKEIFFHHIFEAIAKSNRAIPEHSARVGKDDTYAF